MGKNRKILYHDWMQIWLQNKRKYVKESTYACYSNIVFNHLIPELGNYKMYEINNGLLQELILKKYQIGRVNDIGGLSDKTIRDIGMIIKLSLKDAIKNKIIDNIDLELKYPKKSMVNKIHTFDKNEQKKIISYCMNNINEKNLGIMLTLYTGLRIGELCALKWGDIDFKRNLLFINKTIQRIYVKSEGCSRIIITTPKTKSANRVIPLNREFANILKRYKTNDDYYVTTNKSKFSEPRTFRKYYYKVINEINIKNISFHSLRHTFATNCVRLGVDYKTISELLGHSSVNITLNIYVHPQMAEKKRCINLIYKECNNGKVDINTLC